jgi:excisionase family DNA binding protein
MALLPSLSLISMVAMSTRYLSIYEITEKLSLSARMVMSLIRKGDLPAYRFGQEIRIKESDFEKFIQKSRFSQ